LNDPSLARQSCKVNRYAVGLCPYVVAPARRIALRTRVLSRGVATAARRYVGD